MRAYRWLTLLSTSLLLACAGRLSAHAQDFATAVITTPADGGILQGAVAVRGTADSPDFSYADVSFAYPDDSTGTWFLVGQIDAPVRDGQLVVWDTNSVSDGAYTLRLRVSTRAGVLQQTEVTVEVRNYTTADTVSPSATPKPVPSIEIPPPVIVLNTATVAPPSPVTPTPLPPNPAVATVSDVQGSLLRGALISSGIVLLVAIMLLRRRL